MDHTSEALGNLNANLKKRLRLWEQKNEGDEKAHETAALIRSATGEEIKQWNAAHHRVVSHFPELSAYRRVDLNIYMRMLMKAKEGNYGGESAAV